MPLSLQRTVDFWSVRDAIQIDTPSTEIGGLNQVEHENSHEDHHHQRWNANRQQNLFSTSIPATKCDEG
eukprot:m.41080 g.41080  ORF g.41080 m.41080 type:complete len:69 (-) comp18693_c0_seq1:1954-2160(-)